MGKTAPLLPPRRQEFPSQRKTCEITVKSSRQGLARGKQRVSHYFPLSRAFQGLEEEKVSQDRARRERQARSPNLGLTPTPLPRARRECPDPGAAGRRRLRPALRRAHRFPRAAGPPARDPSCPSGDGLGCPAALRCPRVAGEPVPRGPSAPVGRPVGRSDRSSGGCSAASRSNRASPPPHAAPRSLPPRSAGRRPVAGGRTPEFQVSWGVCDGRGGGRRVRCLRPHGPRSPPRPPPRLAPLHSGLLPSASNLPKRRRLPPGLSYFLAIFGGFFGAIPAWRSARTGYPFRPARLMRSGITRKWRRKRCGSSFKFVRANPAAPGHAGNAGSLHSWPPFPRLPPRPCCACGKLPHTPTPTPRTCA